jgi:hypothetical protein
MGQHEKPGERSEMAANKKQPTPGQLLIWRIVFSVFLAGFGLLLIRGGRQAIHERSIGFDWVSGDGRESVTSDRGSNLVGRGKVHLNGSEAVEHGVGLFAGGVTFSLWSALILWGAAGKQAPKAQWKMVHWLATLLSLACLTTAIVGLFPPWHIPFWPSCDAFYVVMLFFAFLGWQRDRKRIRHFSQRGFPALILGGILVSQLWIGALAGTIAGIFLGIALGLHIVFLIPSLRKLASADLE